VKLFSRLDPLAAGKRSAKQGVPLKKTIEDVLEVFGSEFKENEISMSVTGPDDFVFLCWRQDLYAIFTNLADNSITGSAKKVPLNDKSASISLRKRGLWNTSTTVIQDQALSEASSKRR